MPEWVLLCRCLCSHLTAMADHNHNVEVAVMMGFGWFRVPRKQFSISTLSFFLCSLNAWYLPHPPPHILIARFHRSSRRPSRERQCVSVVKLRRRQASAGRNCVPRAIPNRVTLQSGRWAPDESRCTGPSRGRPLGTALLLARTRPRELPQRWRSQSWGSHQPGERGSERDFGSAHTHSDDRGRGQKGRALFGRQCVEGRRAGGLPRGR